MSRCLNYKNKIIVKHIGSLLLASIGHNRLLTMKYSYFSFQRLSFDLLVAFDLICQPNGHRGNRTHSSILQQIYSLSRLLNGLYVHIGIPNISQIPATSYCASAKHRIIVGFSVLFHHQGFWCFPHVSNKLS